MDDELILEWLELLYDPKQTKEEIIQDLLRNAKADKMSVEDVETCERALEILHAPD